MKNSLILFLWICFFILSCTSAEKRLEQAAETTKSAAQSVGFSPSYDEFGNTQIFTDSSFSEKRYKILITSFSKEKSYFEGDYNSIFQLSEFKNGHFHEIYKDSIQRHFDEVLFEDFTNDGHKEIMIENISDVRSNITYYLYKIDRLNSKVTKIKDFETIKNPAFLPEYNLITNLVMSGRNWTSFYEIQDDKVKDYDIVIYDGEDENGVYSYDEDYNKAIKKIIDDRNTLKKIMLKD